MSRWGPAEHLLADLWEATVNRGRKKSKPPIKFPRPTEADRPQTTSERETKKSRRRDKLLRLQARQRAALNK